MKIRPLNDKIILKPEPKKEVTTGGIVIPDSVKGGKASHATVVAVGPGAVLEDGTRAPIDLSEGDRVVISKESGQEVEVEGEKFIVCFEADIIAVL